MSLSSGDDAHGEWPPIKLHVDDESAVHEDSYDVDIDAVSAVHEDWDDGDVGDDEDPLTQHRVRVPPEGAYENEVERPESRMLIATHL